MLMRRRIIRQGHNTFTVTVPIKWAKFNRLDAGDEVDVIEQGSSLVINSDKVNKRLGRAEIDIAGLPTQLLWRFVSGAYRAGYDEIKINFEGMEEDKERFSKFSYDITDWFYKGELPKDKAAKLSPIEALQALINRFIGVEITEQRPGHVIVKQFGEISYHEFGNALRRIFMIIASMGNDILAAIKKNDRVVLKSIHMADTNVDRFEDYCLRVLNVKGYEDFKKTPTVYSTILLLELVGDEYKRIALHVIRDNHKYGSAVMRFFGEVNNEFQDYFDLFYSFDRAKAVKIFEKEDQFSDESKKLLKTATADEKELLHHMKKITRLIVSLTELAIDLKA